MIGALFALSSLFADQIALGMPGSGFGLKQMIGTVAGILITFGGIQILRRYPASDEKPIDEQMRDEQP